VTRLALGTVQFGLNYGVSNTNGQVPIEVSKKILELAKEHDINTLDTAPGYGNSEKVLGKIGCNDFQIITKTIPLKLGVENVLQSFHLSLINLHINSVDGLLIHNIDDVKNRQFDILYKELNKLKQDKLIEKIGFSIYTPDQVEFLLDNFDFDLIQVPFNVFDTRLIDGGQLKALKNKQIEIHARSVFLQGLLLNFAQLDGHFDKWKKQFNNYQKMVEVSGCSLLEYALNFALNVPELDKILVGVESTSQLRDIINVPMLNTNLKEFSINDIELLNPVYWK